MCWSHRCLCKVSEQPLSIVFVSVLVWEPWFLEQRFGSHSKWWQRQWWDRTQNPKGGSHFRLVQYTKALICGVWWCHCSENHIVQPPQQRLLLYVYLWRVGVLDICKLLNFLKTFGCQFEIIVGLKVWLSRCHPPVILLSLWKQCRLFFSSWHMGVGWSTGMFAEW